MQVQIISLRPADSVDASSQPSASDRFENAVPVAAPVTASSTSVRNLVASGDVAGVWRYLGRSYSLAVPTDVLSTAGYTGGGRQLENAWGSGEWLSSSSDEGGAAPGMASTASAEGAAGRSSGGAGELPSAPLPVPGWVQAASAAAEMAADAGRAASVLEFDSASASNQVPGEGAYRVCAFCDRRGVGEEHGCDGSLYVAGGHCTLTLEGGLQLLGGHLRIDLLDRLGHEA